MKTTTFAALGAVTLCSIASADDLTIPTGGRVTIELLFAAADFDNTMSISSPAVGVAASGCLLQPSGGLGGLAVVSEQVSQHGCRVELDADPGMPGIQPFAAGTTFEFMMCAQTDADPTCEFVWSSDPADNSDGFDHLRTTALAPDPMRIFLLEWEDLENGGDMDFNDLVLVLRVANDTDGDGLWDDWETLGIDADADGSIDLDLPALGADPMRRNMFVEVDYMDCAVMGGDCAAGDMHSHIPSAAAIAAVVQSFANAPVMNPDGTTGIDLRVDISNSIPHQNLMNIPGLCFNGGPGIGDFDATKADPANFGPNNPRRFAYHYCIFTHRQFMNRTVSGCGELPGNDFQVSLGGWNVGAGDTDGDGVNDQDVGTVAQQAGTFMHELGHNLNLRHGGDDNVNRKPNYLSCMNYAFQMPGIPGTDPDGAAGPLIGRIDYSPEDLADLNENNLNEAVAVGATLMDNTFYFCPGLVGATGSATAAIDWNCDNDMVPNDSMIAVNINGDCMDTSGDGRCQVGEPIILSTLSGYNDWANIKYDFQNAGDFADGVHSFSDIIECIDVVNSTPPTPDAGSAPDGNPNTPPGPPFEPYTCNLGEVVMLDGTGSFDANGVVVAYQWDTPGGGSVDAKGPMAAVPCDCFVGENLLSLTVTDDDGLMATDVATLIVTLDAGPDQIVECTSPEGAVVTLGAGLPDCASLSYTWQNSSGMVVGTAPEIQLTLPLGSHEISLMVSDSNGNKVADTVEVTVEDTTPPSIGDLETAALLLWPPNHQLVNVDLSATVTDVCDPAPVVVVSVFSDEDDSQNGSGSTAPDAAGFALGDLELRRERSGRGDGRVYLILVTATDASGNSSHGCTTVVVPHDQSAVSIAGVFAQAANAQAACTMTGKPPVGFVPVGE